MVLVYSHVEDFFPAEDVPAARDALRSWLWEKRDDAREAREGALARVEGEARRALRRRTSARCGRSSSPRSIAAHETT